MYRIDAGTALRKKREEKQLTQPQLSALTDFQVSTRTISDYETTGSVTVKSAKTVAAALGLDLSELLTQAARKRSRRNANARAERRASVG